MNEPRTTADIMSDMLDFATEHEWSDDIHAWGDYYEKGCRDCGATKDVKLKNTPCGEHAPGCARYRLLEEARAFVRAEQELAAGARPEAEPAHRQASTDAECPGEHCSMCNGEACAKCGAGTRSRFGEEPCEHDVMDRHEEGRDTAAATLTREEALRRLDALSPTAARHLASARDWLAAYEKSAYRDSERDKMAKILRAYVAGLDAAPVDVPHDLRVDQLSRFAGADVAEEPWTPTVGDRVVTAEKLTGRWQDRMRRPSAVGEVLRECPGGWWVRHDGGTEAPYDTDELLPVPKEST